MWIRGINRFLQHSIFGYFWDMMRYGDLTWFNQKTGKKLIVSRGYHGNDWEFNRTAAVEFTGHGKLAYRLPMVTPLFEGTRQDIEWQLLVTGECDAIFEDTYFIGEWNRRNLMVIEFHGLALKWLEGTYDGHQSKYSRLLDSSWIKHAILLHLNQFLSRPNFFQAIW